MLKRICSLFTLIVLVLTQCFTSINYVLAENNAEQYFQVEENVTQEQEDNTSNDTDEDNVDTLQDTQDNEGEVEIEDDDKEGDIHSEISTESENTNEQNSEPSTESEIDDKQDSEVVAESENTDEQNSEPSTESENTDEQSSEPSTESENTDEQNSEPSTESENANEQSPGTSTESDDENEGETIDAITEEIQEIITKIRYFFKMEGNAEFIKYGKDANNIGTITLKDPKASATITIMDRNLGAKVAGIGKESYGYYFQWGNNHGVESVNSSNKTTEKAVYKDSYYGHGYDGNGTFIVGGTDYWENGAHYNSLWGNESRESSRYGACPIGYHIPTIKEWNQLLNIWGKIHTQDTSSNETLLRYSADYSTKNIHTFKGAATQCTKGDIECVDEDKLSSIVEILSSELKLPLAGSYNENGNFHGGLGVYWTSISKNGNMAGVFNVDAYIGRGGDETLMYRSQGHNIRCFKNLEPYEAPANPESQNNESSGTENEETNNDTPMDSQPAEQTSTDEPTSEGQTWDGENSQQNGVNFDESQNNKENTQDSYPENDIPSDNGSDSVIQDTIENLANEKTDVKEYTITWKNEDGSVRDITTVKYGQFPTHEDPVQLSDENFSYKFAGWEPELKVVDGDTEYKAKYVYIPMEYTITWKNEDGTIIDTTRVAYGQKPTHTNPVQPSDETYSYRFAGWEPELKVVDGDAEYRAKYEYILNKCPITWKNEDGTIIDTVEVAYGEIPTHENPIQPGDLHYSYEFSGWIPEISKVIGPVEYRATYKYIVNKYTITRQNEDGTVLETDEVEYGSIPKYDGEIPVKQSDGIYEYSFAGWDSEISGVTGDIVYIATYSAEKIGQNIQDSMIETSQGQDDNILQSGTGNLSSPVGGESYVGDDEENMQCDLEEASQGGIDAQNSSQCSEGQTGCEENEEDSGFFEGLRETLKSFFLEDEDGYIRGSETINDIVVSVEAEEGTFPIGTEVVIKGVSQQRLESIQTSLINDESNNIGENAEIVAFDISFIYSEEEIQPSKEVSVKFNYKENSDFQGASEKELSVYHIDDETDEGQEVEVVSKDGDEIEILATDFSIYVLTLSNDNTITLTLDPGDGTISLGSNIVVDEQGIGTITSVDGNVTLPNATRANYVFVGWYTGQTTSLQNFAGIGGDQYHVNSNITLYAKWCNRGSTINTDKTTCISSWNSKTIMDQNPNFTYGEIEIQRPAGLTDADGPASITIMDRNLGASSAGTSNSAWGYYYQYGNNYGFVENPPTIRRDIANVNLTQYSPSNPYYSGNFVIGKVGNTKHNNWPTTANYNIWGFESSIEEDRQGPCPFGRHIPTIEEWNKVVDYRTGTNGGMNVNNFRTQLGLPLPGGIMRSDAKMEGKGSSGWFTTVSLDLSKEFVYQLAVTSTSYTRGYSENMVNARQIRCFKNEDKSDVRYTVIYKDGEDEEAFEDQIFSGLSLGDDFPEFSGNISSRIGENDSLYEFSGWHLSGSDVPFDVSTAIVRYDTILYAKWNEIHRYTVIYTDGKDDMEIFEDQIFSGLLEGGDFPQFSGNIPSRTGENDRVHDFAGWYLSGTDISFDVSGATVTENIILKAKWTGCPDGEDENAHGECVPTADKQRELQIVQDLDVYFLASDTDKKHYTLMDRNMGAAGVYNKNYGSPNSASFGYVYQWGNNYGFPARGDLAQQGVSTTTSQVPKSIWSLGVPSKYSNMTYYLNSNKDASWMAGGSKTDGIWGGTGDTTSVEGANTTLEGRQGPCPAGYHVPSSVEIVTIFTNWSGVSVYTSWDGTGATSAAVIFSEDFLLPPAGRRAANGAVGMEVAMSYWSSSPHPTKGAERALGFYWNPTDDGLKRQNDDGRLRGRPVRCVKNTANTSTTAIATQDIHLNGGENAVISINNGVISSLRSPTRVDSTFEGWYTSSDFSGNALSVGNSIQAGSSLYAKFTCNESGYIWNGSGCEGGIRLYFDSMGGTEVPSQLIESGMTGTRPADPTKTGYVFSGWFLTGAIEEFDFTGTPITGETTVYAHWNTGEYEVSIVSNNVDYGTVDINSVTADYLTPISTNGNELTIGSTIITATPASSGTEYTYTFSGWNNTCGNTLTGNCTITAEFNRITNGYTITWKNSDGSVLETDTGVVYGAMPSYDGATPTSGGDVQYSYTFDTWIPAISTVIGDAEYVATYTQSVNVYTATIVASPEGYGTVDSGSVSAGYGTSISANGNELTIGSTIITATPTADGLGYTYTFSGWTFNNCGSEGNHEMRPNCEITANFERTTNEYTVIITSSDTNSGTVTTGSITVPYGTTIIKSGNIVTIGSETSTANPNPQTWQYDFNFVNWTDTCGVTVTTGCEITANFESLLKTYTLYLIINTGIETIYYKINGADSFATTGVTTTISGVEAGTEIIAYAEAKTGYTHVETNSSNPWTVIVTGNNVFSPVATTNVDTPYIVYHYVKRVGESTYALTETETGHGITDSILILSGLVKENGFVCAHYDRGSLTGTENGPGEIVTQTTIRGDGTTQIYLYYARNTRTITLTGDEHIQSLEGDGVRECGSERPIDATPKPGYHFVRWDRELNRRSEDNSEDNSEDDTPEG